MRYLIKGGEAERRIGKEFVTLPEIIGAFGPVSADINNGYVYISANCVGLVAIKPVCRIDCPVCIHIREIEDEDDCDGIVGYQVEHMGLVHIENVPVREWECRTELMCDVCGNIGTVEPVEYARKLAEEDYINQNDIDHAAEVIVMLSENEMAGDPDNIVDALEMMDENGDMQENWLEKLR